MRNGSSRSIVLWAAVAVAWLALHGCYATEDDAAGSSRPGEPPSHEMSSSNVPTGSAGHAPVAPPDTTPDATPDDPQPTPRVPTRSSVAIDNEPGFFFLQDGQIVGDLDGDGFDDLVLFGIETPVFGFQGIPPSAAYVFYGRAELPEALSYAHADAVLRGAGFAIPMGNLAAGAAAGDVNGDGRADLAIAAMDHVYFVFGAAERLSGEHDLADVAVSWLFPDMQPPSLARSVRIAAVGDVQGDGLSDLALTITKDQVVENIPGGIDTTPVDVTYLITGQKDAWPEGTFDPEWAHSVFVVEEDDSSGCSLYGAGDLNGDGATELLLQTDDQRRLVLGGDTIPTGTVAAKQAGEAFQLQGGWVRAVPDLDGDGAQEIAWTDVLNSDKLYLTFGDTTRDPAQLVDADTSVVAEGLAVPAAAVTDFDGDGATDLLLVAGASASTPYGLYRIAAAGLRDGRELSLANAEWVLALDGAERSGASPMPLSLDAGGDVNGDGIADLLITTLILGPLADGSTEVRLLISGSDGARRAR